MAILTGPIRREAWAHELGRENGAARPNGKPLEDAGPWEPFVQKLVQFQQLGDNWDGCGAKAPTHELLVSAVALAHLLRNQGVPAPSRVAPGLDGTVLFEWQFPDGAYGEVEIVRPLFAEVMLIEPGLSAKLWTIPYD
jgi:hypothetical protein